MRFIVVILLYLYNKPCSFTKRIWNRKKTLAPDQRQNYCQGIRTVCYDNSDFSSSDFCSAEVSVLNGWLYLAALLTYTMCFTILLIKDRTS